MAHAHSPEVLLIFDDSLVWGLIARRALVALGISHRLVAAHQLERALADTPPAILLAPGGLASSKKTALGEAGGKAVREYVRSGGNYVGFCGGAGLALADGLALCPVCRGSFSSKFEHLISGPLSVTPYTHALTPGDFACSVDLPVWWPGCFGELTSGFGTDGTADTGGMSDMGGVEVLASVDGPSTNDHSVHGLPPFMVADVELGAIDPALRRLWREECGIPLDPDFLTGRPLVVTNRLGAGRVVLSYAHLETPESPQANRWLAHLLGSLMDRPLSINPLPPFDPFAAPEGADPALAEALADTRALIATGMEHLLLFPRCSWLLGWRRGIPGAPISSLHGLLAELNACGRPAPWSSAERDAFAAASCAFHQQARHYLLAERMRMTTLATAPCACEHLGPTRAELFGPPPATGGPFGQLMATLEQLALTMLQPA